MVARFNDLLIDAGVSSDRVRLLRHHHSERRRWITPHQLWLDDRMEFERYQATQNPNERKKFDGKIWASFVVTEADETLFVGLYEAQCHGSAPDGWIDPISHDRPGAAKGIAYDFYQTSLLQTLGTYRGRLTVEWGSGTRSWNQRADNQNKCVTWIGGDAVELDVSDCDAAGTPAGISGLEQQARKLDPQRRERISTYIERGPMGALAKRTQAGRCQLCSATGRDPVAFVKADGSPYAEAHHVFPVSKLLAGSLGIENIMVLCPNHHREMHYGAIQILHYRQAGWTIVIGDRTVEIARTR